MEKLGDHEELFERLLAPVVRELERLGFNDGKSNDPGAIEGLTMHLDTQLGELTAAVSRVGDVLERIADKIAPPGSLDG